MISFVVAFSLFVVYLLFVCLFVCLWLLLLAVLCVSKNFGNGSILSLFIISLFFFSSKVAVFDLT